MNHYPAKPNPPTVGEVLGGRFRLLRVLGEGGSSTVYVAEVVECPAKGSDTAPCSGTFELSVGQQVALKLIHPNLVRNDQVVRRFAREARILRRLAGDHLVAFLDYGRLPDGHLFMAQELVEGESLDCIAGGKPMDPTRAIHIMLQVCCALETAHNAGVIHRDLKPMNVIIEQRERADHARVLDFGMAKILRGDLKQSVIALTQQNMVFGTPEYVSPEQAGGDEVDERADIYSAGIMLYELITGTVPFQSTTPIATMTAHLMERPEPPSRRAPLVPIPPALERLVLHALAKKPADRYPSARAMAAALELTLTNPDDVESIRPPPVAEDPGLWDTDLALHVTTALGRTEVHVSPPACSNRESPPNPLGRGWLVFAIGAALLGVAIGLLMSFVGVL